MAAGLVKKFPGSFSSTPTVSFPGRLCCLDAGTLPASIDAWPLACTCFLLLTRSIARRAMRGVAMGMDEGSLHAWLGWAGRCLYIYYCVLAAGARAADANIILRFSDPHGAVSLPGLVVSLCIHVVLFRPRMGRVSVIEHAFMRVPILDTHHSLESAMLLHSRSWRGNSLTMRPAPNSAEPCPQSVVEQLSRIIERYAIPTPPCLGRGCPPRLIREKVYRTAPACVRGAPHGSTGPSSPPGSTAGGCPWP